MNYRLKPKCNKARLLAILFFVAFILLAIFLFYIGITEGESLEEIVMPVFLGSICTYMLMSTPMMERNVKIYISETGNLSVFYKYKEVIVDFVKDEAGKLDFANPDKKNECVRYADGSVISSKIQDKVVWYLIDVLRTNEMLSNDPFKFQKTTNTDIKAPSQSETMTKEEQKRKADKAKKTSKIWAVACIICIVITYLSYDSAMKKKDDLLENYDFSQLEEYNGVVTDITTSTSRVSGHSKTSYYEEILLENGETISLGPSGEGRHYMVGKEVVVYTNQRHTAWSYRKEGVALEENNVFFNFIPIFIWATGVAFCFVQFMGSFNEQKK